MKLHTPLLFVLIMLLGSISQDALAQQDTAEKISGLFPNVSFERFANQISGRTSYSFYFDPRELKDVQVNLSVRDYELKEVLDIVFRETAFKYEIDAKKRVFVTKGEKLNIRLPRDFFKGREALSEADSLGGNADGARKFSKNKLWVIGSQEESISPTHARLSGTVRGLENGQPVAGAVVFEKENFIQAVTDREGNYSIELPKGRHSLVIQNMGGFQEYRQIHLQGDGVLDISIEESIISLNEVVVSSGKLSNISRPEMGVQSLSIQSMKKLPAILGEVDVIQSILTLPGVSTVGEASAGFNVRGGAADQNLILYQHATIYNPTHLFGFFSAFNPDVVEGVDLYKAGMPVQYGGRLSSVLDVKTNFGNAEKITGAGGIGLLTGRLSVQGPIGEKTTFMLGGRSTYSNWLLDLLDEHTAFSGSRASFYDLNFNLRHTVDDKNQLYLTSYLSQDDFSFERDTLFAYSNRNINLGWKHYYNDRMESEMVVGMDRYDFSIDGRQNILNTFRFGFDISQWYLKSNFKYEFNDRHTFTFGVNSIYYQLNPGHLDPGAESLILPEQVDREQALETAFYFGDEWEVNEQLTLHYGGRYVLYNFLGPSLINQYAGPPGESSLVGQTAYEGGNIVNTYHGPEFRISGRYSLDNFSSFKAGYNTMRQHIHLLSNTSAITPTDTWKLSDPHIRPQWGDQLSLGYYRNLKGNDYETSLEVYHRNMKNLIDYSSGASIILNNEIEQDILKTEGKAYGAEIMLRKNSGKLTGWVSYTFSRSLLRTAEEENREKINDGAYYPSNFDQPHNVVLVANYELSKRINTSLNANYSTGRPVTLPVSKFTYAGSERIFFSDRNQYRIPDYFRIDFSVNLEGNHKVRKLAHSSWSLGVYNLLGRSNPYSVFFAPVNGIMEGFQLSIFAQPIPFITYNFRF